MMIMIKRSIVIDKRKYEDEFRRALDAISR
jgi:hypothetical protein